MNVKIKGNANGNIVVIEAEGKKVLVGVTPIGVMVTDGTEEPVSLEPVMEDELSIDFLLQEFGPEKTEHIYKCFGFVKEEFLKAMQSIENELDDGNTINVHGESRDDMYLE